jgi:hypothetical protein
MWYAIVVACVALLFSCGGKVAGDEQVTQPPQTTFDYCADLAKIQCHKVFTCPVTTDVQTLRQQFPDETSCTTSTANRCTGENAGCMTTIDPSAALACLHDSEGMSCSELIVYTPTSSCMKVCNK